LYENSGAGAANLTLVKENTQLGSVHGHIPTAIIKVNIGGFAA
jgi:hypothetical protein